MKRNAFPAKKSAFTLIELLVVIAIIALLAAVLFPVFASAREKGRQTACLSNQHQIGLAMMAYAEDYDDRFPLAGDPADINIPNVSWFGSPFLPVILSLKPLPDVLFPYTKSKAIWNCPSDTGFQNVALSRHPFDTRPSSFERYGSSYYYFTNYVLHDDPFATIKAWNADAPHEERTASQMVVIYDGSEAWHGGGFLQAGRVNALYVDGHSKSLSRDELVRAGRLRWTAPAP